MDARHVEPGVTGVRILGGVGVRSYCRAAGQCRRLPRHLAVLTERRNDRFVLSVCCAMGLRGFLVQARLVRQFLGRHSCPSRGVRVGSPPAMTPQRLSAGCSRSPGAYRPARSRASAGAALS
jgi:hypothetical protein